ncbi:MAG: hypothetical protein N2110_07665 [Flavobacteriales bacterium]|nr:hypothetical protein [Flavobacteriales bacterium]MCX7768882.1 hypothetical protein [Flavobacteriales bacterium]MDW8410839.1 hypothetical protein [Flavobacteriales bacterium]
MNASLKRFLLTTGAAGVAAYVASYLTEWWAAGPLSAAVVAFVWPLRRGAFWPGFVAMLLLWGALSLGTHVYTGGHLTERMARLLPLGGRSGLLIFLTALSGALLGGLCTATGALLRKLLNPGRKMLS